MAEVKAAFVILCDTREQRPPPFPAGVELQRATLAEGDYTSLACQGIAVVERKSPSDMAGSLTHGRERFDDEIRRLLAYRWRAIVVEGSMDEVWRASGVHPHSVIGSVASFLARSDLPTLFVPNPASAGRMIAGVLKRWGERLAAEVGQNDAPPG